MIADLDLSLRASKYRRNDMQMTKPGASERRATRLIFLLCGMAHSSWAPLVPYAKARVHANDQYFGLLLLCFGAGSLLSMATMGGPSRPLWLQTPHSIFRGRHLSGIGGRLGGSFVRSSCPIAFLFGASIGAIDVGDECAGLTGRKTQQ
jgi:hypothetical protein